MRPGLLVRRRQYPLPPAVDRSGRWTAQASAVMQQTHQRTLRSRDADDCRACSFITQFPLDALCTVLKSVKSPNPSPFGELRGVVAELPGRAVTGGSLPVSSPKRRQADEAHRFGSSRTRLVELYVSSTRVAAAQVAAGEVAVGQLDLEYVVS